MVVTFLVVEHRLWGMPASVIVTCGLSSCGAQALEPRLDSCGSWAYLLQGMWDLPRSGIEPVSPALTGGFFTTETLGKPLVLIAFKLQNPDSKVPPNSADF